MKYKKCCGRLDVKRPITSTSYPRLISKEVLAAIERRKAETLIREQQQGLGNSIVSVEIGDKRLVAVGDTLYSSKNWKTFPDFLSDYLKRELGEDWWNFEIAKPFSERHPVLQWYEHIVNIKKSILILRKLFKTLH